MTRVFDASSTRQRCWHVERTRLVSGIIEGTPRSTRPISSGPETDH